MSDLETPTAAADTPAPELAALDPIPVPVAAALAGSAQLYEGDCLETLAGMWEHSFPLFDACISDPPYHLASIVARFGASNAAPAQSTGATGVYGRASAGFMGKEWDGGDIAFRPDTWRAVYNVLKPGAYCLAFGASRNFGFMQAAIGQAGFEIRDTILWLFGSGFPKSHAASLDWEKKLCNRVEYLTETGATKSIWRYKDDGAEMQREAPYRHPLAQEWAGWGTALKPAAEFITLARKPFARALIDNLEKNHVGALNTEACNVGGRWPANLVHDGSPDVEAAFRGYGETGAASGIKKLDLPQIDKVGNASRFFYSAKASADDKLDSNHPTIKPVDLMRWLARLVVPPGGHVLDPFAGTGTTAAACLREGFACSLMERDPEYIEDIKARFKRFRGEDTPLFSGL